MNNLYLIVAMTKNRVIGNNGQMPWHISDDLKLFKKLTSGGVVIMGRKTYESIGKPLPDRENLVISSKVNDIDGCKVFDSILMSVRYAETTGKKIFFIGGAEIYKMVIGIADHMYISHVKEEYDGDTYFPQFNADLWKVIETEDYKDFTWMHYIRV